MIENKIIIAIVFLICLVATGTKASAEVTCCDPHTNICIMLFDPSCDLPLCSPNPPINVYINNLAPYVLDCPATDISLIVAAGWVIIAPGGSLTLG